MMDNNARFQVNDLIVYGSSGVCIVKDICSLDIDGIDTAKCYYMLEPVYTKGNTIYSPVDNTKTVMRKILTKEESQDLIMRIPSIEAFWTDDKKIREAECKQALSTYDCDALVKIIKTLYPRKEALNQQKKPLGQIEGRYLEQATNLLHGELAISLEMPKEEVESFIADQIIPTRITETLH